MGLKKFFTSWPADRWIALSATIIAICSLILSVWQGVVIREHNKVSVRPIITISGTHNDKGSGWLLGNAGLGPALVKWVEVIVDGKPMKHWREFAAELGLPKDLTYAYWVPAPATVIPPQEPRYLFWVFPGEADKILRSTSKRITIKICYSSIYGECWLASGSPNSPAFLPCGEEPKVHFESPPFK